jgi:hypothetical protein
MARWSFNEHYPANATQRNTYLLTLCISSSSSSSSSSSFGRNELQLQLQLAALRYAKYWDKRVEMFGPKKAFLPLTLSQALKDDAVALSYGFISLTGTKDASGRAIVFLEPAKQDKTKYPRESMCRALWYVAHAALEDEMTQRRGIVILVYPYRAKISQMDRKLIKMHVDSIKSCLPLRLSGIHLCHPPTFLLLVLPVFKLFMGKRMRNRLQVHSGSKDKVLEHIQMFGLLKESIPQELGGNAKLDYPAWLEQRRAAGL